MKLSPLKLTSYFCSDISFSANSDFDPTKPVELKLTEFSCNNKVEPVKDAERQYQVELSVKHQISKKSNSPCSYSVEIIGFFEIAEAFPAEKREQAVRVNAPSVLYGIAREIVRSITTHGPFNAVIVPTVSFIDEAISKGSRPSLPVGEPKEAKSIEMGTKVLP
jgi:preprotein translocase subunit SecB